MPDKVKEMPKKPNILIIMGDDIGWFNVSAYNHGIMGYRTPNIDRLAQEGAMFTDWYGQQSCTAGRAAFITGQSPIRTGLTKVGLPGADLGLHLGERGVDVAVDVELERDGGLAELDIGRHVPQALRGDDRFLDGIDHLRFHDIGRGPGPGEVAQIKGRVDRRLDEENGPGKGFGCERRDDREGDQPATRRRQSRAAQHEVEEERNADAEQHFAEADEDEPGQVIVSGERRGERQQQVVGNPEYQRQPDDGADSLIAQFGKVRAGFERLDVRRIERKCGHEVTIAHGARACRLPFSRNLRTFTR